MIPYLLPPHRPTAMALAVLAHFHEIMNPTNPSTPIPLPAIDEVVQPANAIGVTLSRKPRPSGVAPLAWLWEARAAQGVSLFELASKLGLQAKVLDEIERGARPMRADKLEEAVELLGVSLDTALGAPDDESVLDCEPEALEEALSRWKEPVADGAAYAPSAPVTEHMRERQKQHDRAVRSHRLSAARRLVSAAQAAAAQAAMDAQAVKDAIRSYTAIEAPVRAAAEAKLVAIRTERDALIRQYEADCESRAWGADLHGRLISAGTTIEKILAAGVEIVQQKPDYGLSREEFNARSSALGDQIKRLEAVTAHRVLDLDRLEAVAKADGHADILAAIGKAHIALGMVPAAAELEAA